MQDHAEDSLTVRSTTGAHDFESAMAVRLQVFVEEQGVPIEEEADDQDAEGDHVLAELGGIVVGTGRLVVEPDGARIGRVAVLRGYRHRGIATRIVEALERQAEARGFTEVSLHAQTYVRELYDKCGYVVSGPQFVEAGIDHLPMTKRLT